MASHTASSSGLIVMPPFGYRWRRKDTNPGIEDTRSISFKHPSTPWLGSNAVPPNRSGAEAQNSDMKSL